MPSRILVVESEPTLAAELGRRLVSLGYGIAGVATTVEEAIAAATKGQPGVALINQHLAGPPEAATLLSDQLWERFRLPVVFLVQQRDGTGRLPPRFEPFGHVCHPYPAEALQAAIELALQRQHPRLPAAADGAPRLASTMGPPGRNLHLLAGMVAHDLNNLLTVIRSHVDQCLASLPPQSASAEHLRATDDAVQLAGQLCHQIMAQARGGPATWEPVDLGRLTADTVRIVRGSLDNQPQIDLDLAVGLPSLWGDPAQLQQVVVNLLFNAAEAGTPGRTQIRVTTRQDELRPEQLLDMVRWDDTRPGPHLLLEVADNGRGLAADLLPRLFDPNFSTKADGRGLGLAAVAEIMRLHRGAIAVRSQPGQGTTFQLAFALGLAAGPASTPHPASEAEP